MEDKMNLSILENDLHHISICFMRKLISQYEESNLVEL